VASARARNVIVGDDWSDDRLIPDAVRAWQAGRPLAVRRPQAIRPWQHVLEPLAGYLTHKLWERPDLAGAYNFGPETNETFTVRALVELVRAAYGDGEVRYEEEADGPHEAGRLALEAPASRLASGRFGRWPRLCSGRWRGAVPSTRVLTRGHCATRKSRLTVSGLLAPSPTLGGNRRLSDLNREGWTYVRH
jgi:hypothetical protein